MRLRLLKAAPAWAVLAATGLVGLAGTPAHAQWGHHQRQDCPPAPYYPAPQYRPPTTTTPTPAPTPTPTPAPTPTAPTPGVPGMEAALPAEPSFVAGGETVSVADSSVGYIDSALIGSQLRVRFDSAHDNVRPDRAEFFYAKCGCFRDIADPHLRDPDARGPGPVPERSVDYQDFQTYLELAVNPWLSGFVEVPVRFLNPEILDNTSGLADINAGFKVALIQTDDTTATFQFRTYAPTGESERGLGTGHVSLEPGLLAYQRLSECLHLESELKIWVPIDGSDFAGEVVRYGVGLGYDIVNDGDFRVTPIAEIVGWTVVDGKALVLHPNNQVSIEEADGDTIVNAKLGVRVGGNVGDVYAGYGRALTGHTWYEDVYRLEFRLLF